MKRGGILAFIIYLLFGAGAALTLMIFNIAPPAFDSLGQALAAIVLLYYSAVVFVPMLVVKALHMLTGWKFFSIICAIGNVVVIGLFVWSAITSIVAGDGIGDFISMLIVIAPPTVALISEIVGLKEA